jgi:glutamyl-tRNA synthetase
MDPGQIVAAQPNQAVVGRLAPSPTGAQHVGNARTYLLAWLLARSQHGRVILRIEDIDSPRIKPMAERQAIDDLRWLGLDWDEGPDVGGTHAPYVQNQRLAHYHAALAKLKDAQRIYPCTCTRSDVAAAASAPHAGQEGPLYPGTCSGRTVADTRALVAAGKPYCWRFRATGQDRELSDLFAGSQSCNVKQRLGDFVLAKDDETPAYQLAVVVDDHAMGVTQVLRGDDLLPSAFRQLELYDFFGWQPPAFAHVPLVVGPDGRRLAKRHGDTRLALLRELGVPADRLVGFLAWSCGLIPNNRPALAHELIADFSLESIPREPLVLAPEMLSSLIGGT